MKYVELSTPIDLKTFIPDFYHLIAYDDKPDVSDFASKGLWITLMEDELVCGFIKLDPINNVMWNTHIFIYESWRGAGSEEWGKLTAQWMAKKYGAKKFLAITPYENAKKYAERLGMKCIGTLQASIKKNGKLLDQYMLEIDVGDDLR